MNNNIGQYEEYGQPFGQDAMQRADEQTVIPELEAIEQQKIIQEYLKDDIPQKDDTFKGFQNRFWAFFGRNQKLTFYGEKIIEILELEYRSAELDYLMSKPSESFTWDDNLHLKNIEMNFRASFHRSIGTQTGVVNERTAPHHQSVRQHIQTGTPKQSRMGKLRGFL